MPSYFLVAVSTRENLQLCVQHGLAGFPRSGPGVWAYEDITVGDYISFLYGAKVHNLYKVAERRAYLDAAALPPWEPLVFASGRRYDFAYRLLLEPVVGLTESIARPEFSYVGENLLLRGGYGKTHIQADQVTFNQVSAMRGSPHPPLQSLALPRGDFEPQFERGRPTRPILQLTELIVQSVIRKHLLDPTNRAAFLSPFGIGEADSWEFLSEKALESGFVDIFGKEAHPTGRQRTLPVEVKLNRLTSKDVAQVAKYRRELGEFCVGGALIGEGASTKTVHEAERSGILPFSYELHGLTQPAPFAEIANAIRLVPLA